MGRKFGEHHCRALSSAFVVAQFADRFARRLHCQLADLALGLPRCLTFLPREAASATRSTVAAQQAGKKEAPQLAGPDERINGWGKKGLKVSS
jgi:hypothetical protein